MVLETLKELFNKVFGDRYYVTEDKLNDRLQIRVNSDEKLLLDKYCKLRGISKSDLVRALLKREIDNFIKTEMETKQIPYMR